MTDEELNRKCAERMGWHTGRLASKVVAYDVSKCAIIAGNDEGGESVYDPLHNDAQCFALVERFGLQIEAGDTCSIAEGGDWLVWRPNPNRWVRDGKPDGRNDLVADRDIKRAIVECVAGMK